MNIQIFKNFQAVFKIEIVNDVVFISLLISVYILEISLLAPFIHIIY